MSNTQISYLYRDASNYKQHESIIVEGEISEHDIDIIMQKLVDGFLFIPEQVGLEKLQQKFDHLDNDDHVFHELYRENIRLVEEPPTVTISAKQLVKKFRYVKWNVAKSDKGLWGKWG